MKKTATTNDVLSAISIIAAVLLAYAESDGLSEAVIKKFARVFIGTEVEVTRKKPRKRIKT